MNSYIKSNLIPIILEIIFVISCFILPREYFIYSNFAFYSLLLIYFVVKKDISLKEWFSSLKGGKKFWKQTIITFILLFTAFAATSMLENLLPNLNTGMIPLKTNNWFTFSIFVISTLLYPAIIEETFFRKNLISFNSKKAVWLTSLLSMFLYALEHALTLWGIFLVMLWALPLTVSYIKTKNIYVPMTAHFIGNLFGNGIDIVMYIFSRL